MAIAYIDCFSGISGDMCLGALVDAGLPLEYLAKELKKIPVGGYRLSAERVRRAHLSACKVNVVLTGKGLTRSVKTWKDLSTVIRDADLPDTIKAQGLAIFRALFEAEARVHGEALRTVHLHDIGAIDTVIDIFGTIIGLHFFKAETLYSSPVNLGSGLVKTRHGTLPVPAPATIALLRHVPVYGHPLRSELTTPTGAALLRGLVTEYGFMPPMSIETMGTGAGERNYRQWPNVLRLFIGTPSVRSPKGDRAGDGETVIVIETNIDDMNPQIFDHVSALLYRIGALDVSLTYLMMKKGRPGVRMTVLCEKERMERIAEVILRETTSIGIRYYEARRKTMEREIRSVDTPFGAIRFKVSKLGEKIVKWAPEYEDCRKAARRLNMPLIELLKKIQKTESP